MTKTMITNALATVLALGLAIPVADPASAAGRRNCAARQVVLDALARKYGETRQSIGLGADDAVIEVFASAETRTWTITVTTGDGQTCLVASGQSYEALAEALPPAGSGA